MAFQIAVFSLNQWALDFTGNLERILKSIDFAHSVEASYRCGPELEICGYSLEDAFFEEDTVYHSWISVLKIISYTSQMNMIIDVGMPVRNVALYNCRVLIYKGQILCIRAKTSLAREGNYREARHFTPWKVGHGIVSFKLPSFVSKEIKQDYVVFGSDFVLEISQDNENCDSIRIGWDICQELWDIKNTSSSLYQDFGCHLVVNGSASYWELRKLNTVVDMIRGISLRGGACYAFSNCVGCDGNRMVFYGRSCIFDRGQLIQMTGTSNDIFDEVQMIAHTIEPRKIDEYRAQMGINFTNGLKKVWTISSGDMSQIDNTYNRIHLVMDAPGNYHIYRPPRIDPKVLQVRFEQEIDLYVPLWLWDYLRRSCMKGFMMPLSGGLDSSTVAVLIYNMCNYVFNNLKNTAVETYFSTAHDIAPNQLETKFKSPSSICAILLKTAYLSTKYSSDDTRRRAALLSSAIGAEFHDLSLQEEYDSLRNKLDSGDRQQVTLLDQNLQARLRMLTTYYLSGGNRIVLATGNVDEGIMGYLTKYDCSSADINPIGGLCKNDLKSYLKYCCQDVFKENIELVQILGEIIAAPPSAELTGAEQRDEDEIGLTYDEISVLGKVRKGIYGCSGPRGAFLTVWMNRFEEPYCNKIRCLRPELSVEHKARDLAKLIKLFYSRYARNRHKLTVLTPALHAETYSPDDNRFDHRHFLYAPWTEQFASIDSMVSDIIMKRC